jgi:hypothetical protein
VPNFVVAHTHVPPTATALLPVLVVAQSGTQSVIASEPAAEVPPKGHVTGVSLPPASASEPPGLYLPAGDSLITPKGEEVANAEM